MKLHSAALVLSLFSASVLSAQEVQKCCGTSNSTYLFGVVSSAQHSQLLFLPADLNNAQDGIINRLYFRYGNTGQNSGTTLTDLIIRMGHTSATGFTSGNLFFTDLETVVPASTVTIPPGVTGGWFSIPVDPFQYSADSTLILDVQLGASSTSNFGTYGTSNSGRKLYANNSSTPTGTTSSSTWQDFGFSFTTTSVTTVQGKNALQLVPMPGNDQWQLLWEGNKMSGASVRLIDAIGKVLRSSSVPSNTDTYTLDMTSYSTGIYLVQLRTSDGVVRTQRFFRP